MSSNNNEVNGMMFAIIIVGVVAFFMFAFIFAVAAFITIILTVLCVLAWNKPLNLGKYTLEPEEARAFIIRGIAGVVIIPAFAAFASALFGFEIREDFWEYIYLGGYVAGSLGVALMLGDEETPASNVEVLPPLPKPAPPPVQKSEPVEPFEFAKWDDEEDRR